jgi:hypothetical protein
MNSRGLRTVCPTIEEQDAFLKSIGMPAHAIPCNSDNRRNVGYLMALEAQPNFVISIDDDNYCSDDEDAFAEHSVTCRGAKLQPVVESSTSFFNICSLLQFEKPAPVYPRGYPYAMRHQTETILAAQKRRVPVHINTGLWTIDPDVDGITWLVSKPKVTGFSGRSVVLGSKTWSAGTARTPAWRQRRCRRTISCAWRTRSRELRSIATEYFLRLFRSGMRQTSGRLLALRNSDCPAPPE